MTHATLPAAPTAARIRGYTDPAKRLLTLAGEYVREILADTDQLVAAAEARAREIPAAPQLVRQVEAGWRELGALLLRHAALELTVQEQATELARLRREVDYLRRTR